MILEYKMDKGPAGMHTPYWVENGGYFPDPDNFTMVGISPDIREYKIPDSVVRLTEAQLADRVLGIHSRYPISDPDGNTLTEQQVRDMVATWCASNN